MPGDGREGGGVCRRKKEKGRSREGVKLTEVVRDDDDTALVLLDRACERIDGGHVQVVRRLVQEEDVRVLHRELREHDSATPHDTHAHITRAEEMWEKEETEGFVSSNSTARDGLPTATHRFRRPSESCLMGEVWCAPVRPKRPSCARHAWMSFSGYFSW